MSVSFGKKSADTQQTSKTQTDPWAPTQPALMDFLSQLKTASPGVGTLNGTEQDAFAKLQKNASEGNPWADDISKLTDRYFAAPSRSGEVEDAYGTMKTQLGDYASGKNLDFNNNPYIQQMLETIRNDAGKSINSQFAGVGRDMSASHINALSRGIAEGEAPVLANLYSDAQGKQIDASKTLGAGGVAAAQTAQALDKDALGTNAMGADVADKALDAKNYGANAQLALAEQIKKLPIDQLGWIAQYLFPMAGLGGQSQSEGTGKVDQTQMGLGLKLI